MEFTMNKQTVVKYHWFWAWDDEKEEAWLRQMASQGLHLLSPQPFGRYVFTRGPARDMVYRLDFVTGSQSLANYYQLFKDAGWEHAGQMGGWQYWRTEAANGRTPEILTDNQSKIAKYSRVAGLLALISLVFFPGLFNMFLFNRRLGESSLLFFEYLPIVQISLLVFFICCIIRLLLRINALKKRP
jgi:hypothetical protein